MHAWMAARRGHEVLQLEREPEARGASVRNFGLVWVSGRAPGAELAAALRGRELWEQIGARAPGLGFRPAGSLTLVRTLAEYAVAEAVAEGADAPERGFKLLSPAAARDLNPALRGEFRAALWCERDGVVEPRGAQRALRAALARTSRYRWLPGREVRALTGGGVRDDHGKQHGGDLVLLCPGATLAGLAREVAGDPPVRRVRVQMAQTAPLPDDLTTAVADADSLRYYPAFRGPELDHLNASEPQPGTAAAYAMQLLLVQRLDGSLTIGDTHGYEEPFGFDTPEEPYQHLMRVAGALLGHPLPPIVRRWAGVYAQVTDPGQVAWRHRLGPGAWLVTGPGGRGMTCAPSIAEETMKEAGL